MTPETVPFENSPLFLILLAFAFPVLFVMIWCLVLAITTHMSGWHTLGKLYRYRDQPVTEWIFRGGGAVYRGALPFAGMRGRLAVGLASTGILIKPVFIMRPFHPTLFLPFSEIEREEPHTQLGLEFTRIRMKGAPDVCISILTSARDRASRHRAE